MMFSLFFQFFSLLAFVASAHLYTMPEPSFKALSPKGLQVTLPFTPGDHFIEFQGNINEPIDDHGVGPIFGETNKKTKGQWVINSSNTIVKRGDKIYYLIFVMHGKFGYKTAGIYEIKGVDYSGESKSDDTASNNFFTICTGTLFNLTNQFLSLQNELASVKENSLILTDMIQRDSKLSKTLTLEGLVASDSDLKMLVQAIINDKLKLPYCVVDDVVRQDDGRIEFRVSSLGEKMDVIKAAKTNLKNSRYVIRY